MDLATLQAQHPALYAQVLAQGQKEGAAAELDRIKFHAKMGKKTGAVTFALDACTNGTAKDDGDALAEYLTAGTNRADLAGREKDEAELNGNDPAAADEEAQKATAAKAATDKALALLGIKAEG